MNLNKLIKIFANINKIEQFLPLLGTYFKDELLYGNVSFTDAFLEMGSEEKSSRFVYRYKKNVSLKLYFCRPLEQLEIDGLDLICDSILNNLLVISKLRRISYRGWSAKTLSKKPVCNSESMKLCLESALMVAPHLTTVLLQGETGVGKEILAKYIHSNSERKSAIFLTVNCAALPNSLIDSALFGHVKGAFTGADTDRLGFFEKAKGGTLFLDEIGELPLDTQSRLLRVMEYGDFLPVGSDLVKKADVRILVATHTPLQEAVLQKKFREDLYFRLSTFPLIIPSLRDRKDDIAFLIDELLSELYLKLKIPRKALSSKFYESAMEYDWPGNVRELKNTLEKSLILSKGNKLKLVLEESVLLFRSKVESFDDGVKKVIETALVSSGGKVDGVNGAAELLKLKPQTLYSKMRKYGIKGK